MKRYFITGLLIWVPLGITIWVITFVLSMMDNMARFIPNWARPDHWIIQALPADFPGLAHATTLPGFGIVLTLIILLGTGLFAANILGQRLLRIWEALLSRIPIVRSIYTSVKQVSDSLFSGNGQAFRQALLVQFPHQGAWTIGFLTGYPGGEVACHLKEEYLSVYIPTTPNPTSGYFIMVAKNATITLDMSVDEALKYVISMGVVVPAVSKDRAKRQQPSIQTTTND
jgi:uncharacterized membrane protein